MTMKYRSRADIAANILKLAREKAQTKTRLMYGSFLSFTQINDYMRFLLDKHLLLANEDKTYALTEKGLQFLTGYDILAKTLE